jgi:hypothetical protein
MNLKAKNFLKRKQYKGNIIPPDDGETDYLDENASIAEQRFGLPIKLYKEYSHIFPKSSLGLKTNSGSTHQIQDSAFMSGFICGFIEKNNK